jgi:hypothetical protein
MNGSSKKNRKPRSIASSSGKSDSLDDTLHSSLSFPDINGEEDEVSKMNKLLQMDFTIDHDGK